MLNITDESPVVWRVIKYVTNEISDTPKSLWDIDMKQRRKVSDFFKFSDHTFDTEASKFIGTFLRKRAFSQAALTVAGMEFIGKSDARVMQFVPQTTFIRPLVERLIQFNNHGDNVQDASTTVGVNTVYSSILNEYNSPATGVLGSECDECVGNIVDCRDPEAEENDQLYALLVKRMDKNKHVKVKAPNNMCVHWYCLPERKQNCECDNYRTMSNNGMVNTLQEMITTVCGSIEEGITSFTSMLYHLNPPAFVSSLQASLHIPLLKPLSPVATVALQSAASLSKTQRVKVASFLTHNCGGPVLASERACRVVGKEVLKTQYIAPSFGTHVVRKTNYVSGSVSSTCVHYEVTDMFDVVLDKVRLVSTSYPYIVPGVVLGSVQRMIGVCVQGDFGGHETFVVIAQLIDGGGQHYSQCVGKYNDKENHYIMRNTCLPNIEASVERFNGIALVYAEWKDNEGFLQHDHVHMPLAVASSNNDDNSLHPDVVVEYVSDTDDDTLSATMTLRWGGGESCTFPRMDIPVPSSVTFRVVPFLCTLTGDLAFIMLLQGRHGHASSKCPFCHSCHSEWQTETPHNPAQYTPLTWEGIKEHIVNYRETEMFRLSDRYQRQVDRGAAPPRKKNEVREYFVEARADLPLLWAKKEKADTIAATTGFRTTMPLLTTITIRNTVPPTLHCTLGGGTLLLKTHIEFCERYIEYLEPLAVQALAAVQPVKRKYEEAAAAATAAVYGTKTKLQKVATEAKRDLAACEKTFTELFDRRTNRPVYAAMESILDKDYNIRFQAFHSHSLTGEQVYRWLANSRGIIDAFAALFKGTTLGRERANETELFKKIDAFSAKQKLLSGLFHKISRTMARLTMLNDEEVSEFVSCCKFFVHTWREDGRSVPPKFHIIEHHIPEFMIRFRCLGIFAEQAIEHAHHTTNELNRLFQPVRHWEKKQEFMHTREAMHNSTEVQKILQKTSAEVKSSGSGQRSSKKTAVKIEEELSDAAKEREYIAMACDWYTSTLAEKKG